MRMTMATQRVLHAMLESAPRERYGLELMRATGLKSGTLYPILGRLEENGLAESRWEEVDSSAEGRPRRRLYRLTPNGVASASDTIAETARMLGLRATGGFA
jgi:PadR family transcriptional regulator PadR